MSSEISWIVFYDDRTTFSNKDGMPWQAPPVGVQVLLQIDANGKWVLYTQDKAYCWEWRSPNEWVPVDDVGISDYLFTHRGPKAILFGRWTSDANYESIWKTANTFWKEEGRRKKNG